MCFMIIYLLNDWSFYIVDNRISSDDVIPHTPLSLLPLLSKIHEQWSSDFETPQAQPHIKKLLTSTTEKVIHLLKYVTFLHCILLFKLQCLVYYKYFRRKKHLNLNNIHLIFQQLKA